MDLLQGKFIGHERGFGFVKISDDEPDIFIAKKNKKDAMNGDLVEVKIIDENSGSSREGAIVQVVQRNTKQVVGTFEKSRNFGFVVPDDNALGTDIFISKSNFGKAKNHQKVVVKITKYPRKGMKAEGKITEVLGYEDETGVDMLSIIKEYNLESEFPKNVLEEAKRVAKRKIKLGKRVDLRDKEIFTIDGEDAKDLDDAVCVDKNADGTYTLGVHIADVSFYVEDGSLLNKEAIKRGTSVYMLDRVIPMLPTELSNGCCSLNEGKDRYAISVIMTIDQKGKVIDSQIFKSIIKVTRRMNYHDVYKIIERKDKKVLKKYESYISHFDRMKELAIILKQRRLKDGYLSLDIPETKITLDKNGKPIDIGPYETNFANEIIEQFMLTANETVAERFYWLEAPFIYRVHEKPDEDKVKELNKYLFNFGYRIKGKLDDIKPKAFSQILEEVKGKEEERVVSNLLLRTLKVARYEAENKGHFGISSKYYCHFTSPIRRYPDLFIHRVISKYLEGINIKTNNENEEKIYDIIDEKAKERFEKQAIKYAESSSECEQNATKAERASEDIKKAEYMQGKIGERYEGIISSITSFGMFVELDNTVEGLIRLAEMNDDYYIYDDLNKQLIGRETKKIYKLGQKVNIEVVFADKQTRKIDFKLV